MGTCGCYSSRDDYTSSTGTCEKLRVNGTVVDKKRTFTRSTALNADKGRHTCFAQPDWTSDSLKMLLSKWLQSMTKLEGAQRMTSTKLGLSVNSVVTSSVLNRGEVEKLGSETSTASDEVKLVLNKPFNEVSRITDFLYLTGIGGLTHENFDELHINLIVNATYELPLVETSKIISVRIPIDDDCDDDIYSYLDEVADLIEKATVERIHTIVHCAAGASRSTSLVLAYLIKYFKKPLKEMFIYAQRARECARPNMGFFEQLIKYEHSIFGKSSVVMSEYMVNGVRVRVPNFYKEEFPYLYKVEENKQLRLHQVEMQNSNRNVRNKPKEQQRLPNRDSCNTNKLDIHSEIINIRNQSIGIPSNKKHRKSAKQLRK